MSELRSVVLYAGTVFMGFFAIMNPLANTPVFLGLTEDDDADTRRAVARRALMLAFLIVSAFALAGTVIFDLFGITLPAFRITGGILVFGIGSKMLQGETSRAHRVEGAVDRETQLSVAVSPLAVPLLAGPGTIATAMNYVLPIEHRSISASPLARSPSSVSSATGSSFQARNWLATSETTPSEP